MSLELVQVTTVVVSSATMAKAILQNHDSSFCNRTVPEAVLANGHHEFGLVLDAYLNAVEKSSKNMQLTYFL